MNRRTTVVVVCALLAAAALPFEVPRTLLLGWIFFLVRVLPRVSPDRGVVIVACIALVLFTAGVHWLGHSWQRRAPPGQQPTGRRWKTGWSLAIVAVVFLLFAAGICAVGITHQVSWLLTEPEPLYGPALKGWSWGGSGTNLRMTGMALGNYAGQYGSLPPGGTFTADGGALHSWETHLLPYLPYDTRGIDFKVAWNDPQNERYFRGPIPQFINPEFRTAPLVDAQGFGLSHYAANSHVLAGNKGMRLQDITDGTSTTLLVCEVNAEFKPWGHPANWRDPADGVNKSPHGFGGPPGSGGAQFAMADGSVRFVGETVSPRVLQALATPNGGEEVPADALGAPR